MNFLIILYILTKSLLLPNLKKFDKLSISTSVFLIAIGDLTFSAIVILFLVLFYLGFRNRMKIYVLRVILISWFAGTSLFIFQLFMYYGINSFLQDMQQTFKLRSSGIENAYEIATSFSISTNTVNLFANNVGVYDFYNFFSRLSSEFLLNFELLDLLTLVGIIFLFYSTFLNHLSKKKSVLSIELIICFSIIVVYLLIFKITYSNDVFWFAINSDTAFYNLLKSINFASLILFLPIFIGLLMVFFYFKFFYLQQDARSA
jgi:hypothetical protein